MHCVSCDSDTDDYDRVAVDRTGGEITGAICLDCWDEVVSRSDDSAIRTMATCSVCGDDADVLFPKWDSIVETNGGPDEFEYTVELTTPALCENCLAANRRSQLVHSPEEAKTD